MRRESLQPPKDLIRGNEALVRLAPQVETAASGAEALVRLEALPLRVGLSSPRQARPVRRRWFEPAKGWFRRTERRVSHFLGCHVYSHIPGASIPYSRQLQRELTLSEGEIELRDLPSSFAGTRVLLLTDLHAGPFVHRDTLAEVCGRLQSLDPDLVLLGGDFLTGHLDELDDVCHALSRLKAPLGIFGVLGNHDHYATRPLHQRARLEEIGVQILHNCSVPLRVGDGTVTLAGIDDLLVGEPDLEAALSVREGPVILLSHNPDIFFRAAESGVALTLSGHTHAGQIRLPGMPVLVRQSQYRLDEGRFRFGGSELLVSRGLGVVGLPWRAHCPPEAVLMTLRTQAAEGIRRMQQL